MPESNVVSQTYTRLYTITVNQAIGGVVSASPTHAAEGATVTLTATPNVGYTFDNEWSVYRRTYRLGDEVVVRIKKTNLDKKQMDLELIEKL